LASLAGKSWVRIQRLANMGRVFLRRNEHAIEELPREYLDRLRSIVGRGGIEDAEPIDLKSIPYKVLISLEQHHGRRSNAQRQFAELGIDVAWKIPVKIDEIPWTWIPQAYRGRPASASHTATLLSVFDEVERTKAESFVVFEDDVIFHPAISTLLPRIRVPRDWKFIYLGGRNTGIKRRISPGLVRSDFVNDLHAVIIRSDMIAHLRRVLLDPAIDSMYTDFRFATLHDRYPAYLCRPNLAWQSVHGDDSGALPAYCNYYGNGTVKIDQGD
jgi:hypothetical protein